MEGQSSEMHRHYESTAVGCSKKTSVRAKEIKTSYKDDLSNAAGRDNQGFSLTLSSHNDLSAIIVECSKGGGRNVVTSDSIWVCIPSLQVRHKIASLYSALRHYYNTKVQPRRFIFHQAMSQMEDKINCILDYVESINPDLQFRRMSPFSYYEIKAQNEIDVFLILDTFSPLDVTIEELGDPQGCARIRLPTSSLSSEKRKIGKSLNSFFDKSKSEPQFLSAKSIGGKFKDLVQKCFEELPRSWREAQPSCKLNSQIYQSGKNLGKRSTTKYKTTQKKVSFEKISEKTNSEISSYIINLIPVVECPILWPVCSNWMKSSSLLWIDQTTNTPIVNQGVHLVAMTTDKDAEDLWNIKFLNARRCLIRHEENKVKQRCLQILKVLCENEVGFSKYFQPIHLEHIYLHQIRRRGPQNEDWPEEKAAEKFLELLVMLYDCLKIRNCPSFFIPEVNLFSGISGVVSESLSGKVLNILTDPISYLLN